MRPKNRRGKRHQGFQEEEEEVDDLAVAASFAQATSLPPKESPQEQDSTNEQNETEAKESSEIYIQSSEKDEDSIHSSVDSDDESDVDLSEALARVTGNDEVGDDDDGEHTICNKENKTDSQAPTTENELDPYRTPISDLETKFQLNLTVAEQERLRLDKETAVPSDGPVQLCAAGHVKCHMIQDRTIVVESVSMGGGSFAALDEGSLLVIRIQDESKVSRLVSLGKIFEVFGPVRKPLYTIRLSSPKDKKTTKTEKKAKASEERDVDEISLDDCESDERGESKAPEALKGASQNETGAKISQSAAEKHDSDDTDPWSPDGKHTKLLQTSERMPVYYISDIAKLLDTGAVIRNSGRGCDASNLYDEEVINANEIDFSDDEQEREHKNRNKRGKKGRRKGNVERGSKAGRGRPPNDSGYTGFHAPPQQAAYPPNQPVQYGMPAYPPMPYQVARSAYPGQPTYPYPPQQPQYGQPGYSYAPYPYQPGTVPPPPPPQYPYPTHPSSAQQQGQESPQESPDTVYYD